MNDGVLAVGEPIIRSALEVLRGYHDVKDGGAPAKEIDRLRRAEDLTCKAVSEFRRLTLNQQPLVRH